MARKIRLLAALTVGIFAILGSLQVNAAPLPIERQSPAYREAAQGAARDTARPKWCKKKKNKDKPACDKKGGGGGGVDNGNCHSSYPDFCIPPPPPDLDCAQVGGSNFTVRGSDPHGFDGDNDGVGCET